ncbi:hypothetical protein PIB30_005499 [Stylosanthes scabra]|uniref:Uncharacterized protein n=1 Tax=Stylosanthes scabra TaxID=79078 RepID=A0ABU6Z0T1_9FABA|nr:hypothetical protein [Stylosanthes scabra]
MSMLGLRDLVFITPNPSSLNQHRQQQSIPTENGYSTITNNNNNPMSVGFGIFPLLAATPCVQVHNNTESSNEAMEDSGNMREKMESDENGGEFRVCTDCGNRAKKDCVYRRCRSCCKGRGYDCTTHVKSTWVPAVRRRERHVDCSGDGADGGALKKMKNNNNGCGSGASYSHSSTSNSCYSQQDARFKESLPGHVRAPAVFRCHRVSAVGNGENEFAYLATVHISGHVFRGFLYDHGVDPKNTIMPCASELQLGNNSISGGGKNKECSSAIGVTTNNDNLYSASAT